MNVRFLPRPALLAAAGHATRLATGAWERRATAREDAARSRRVPAGDIVVVGRSRPKPGTGRIRMRLAAVATGALIGAAIHYGAAIVREWAVITVPPTETSRTVIT